MMLSVLDQVSFLPQPNSRWPQMRMVFVGMIKAKRKTVSVPSLTLRRSCPLLICIEHNPLLSTTLPFCVIGT